MFVLHERRSEKGWRIWCPKMRLLLSLAQIYSGSEDKARPEFGPSHDLHSEATRTFQVRLARKQAGYAPHISRLCSVLNRLIQGRNKGLRRPHPDRKAQFTADLISRHLRPTQHCHSSQAFRDLLKRNNNSKSNTADPESCPRNTTKHSHTIEQDTLQPTRRIQG
jgi:hypothetical protein